MSNLTPPKLTVRIIKRTLGDHFLDFMNANNPHGFQQDEDKEIDEATLSGLLITIAVMPEILQAEARAKAVAITKASGSKIKKTTARVMVAKALGYDSWTEARAARDEQTIIPNRRHIAGRIGQAATDIHSTAKAGLSLEGWTKDRPLPEGYHSRPAGAHHADSWTVRKSGRLGYVQFRELVDLLMGGSVASKAAGQRILNWLHDSNRNVLPGTTQYWVEYKGEGMYVSNATLRLLPKVFKKMGGVRTLWQLDPYHFYVEGYARMKAMDLPDE